jgi:sensor histidine kinase YesM
MERLLRSRKFWLAALALLTLLGLAEAAQYHAGSAASGRPISWGRSLSSVMPSWLVYLPLLPAVAWMVRRFPLEGRAWLVSVPVHLLAAALFTVLHLSAASYASDFLLYDKLPMSFGDNLVRILTMYGVLGITFYWALLGAMVAYESTVRYREQERAADQLSLKASRLEAGLARANLDALRMQLNPHFLFNALNSVSVLALKGERREVVRTLARLSDLLRTSLENERHQVTLAEELRFLDAYLEIEKMRFKDRLTVTRTVDPDLLDAQVPSLLLQPLVENAVRHGIARRTGPGRIDVGARSDGYRLVLTVQVTGPGFSATPSTSGAGVGLANTRARLEQLYGTDFMFETRDAPGGGALVRVGFLMRRAQDTAAPLPQHA